MKLVFIFLPVLLFLSYKNSPGYLTLKQTSICNHRSSLQSTGDSAGPIHIINNSSLKHLPAVLRDLSVALKESVFICEGLLNKDGFDIVLQDALYKQFDTSASVMFQDGDTSYHLKINRSNKLASDRALAATLIHEIMHCMLLDIDRRARTGDRSALFITEKFNQRLNISDAYKNGFFYLMNSASDGQHELIYQLFYPDMVALLKRFAQIHRQSFPELLDAEYLMWSGLQETAAFKKLSLEEKSQIEVTILKEKGLVLGPMQVSF